MVNSFYRCARTTAVYVALISAWLGVANAQQSPYAIDKVFDDLPPQVVDNLPPNISVEDWIKLPEVSVPEVVEVAPSISSSMHPFNSRRIDLVEALQYQPTQVIIGGQSVALHHPELVAHFYESENYPTVWTHEDSLSEQVTALAQVVANAGSDALNPAHYHDTYLRSLTPNTQTQDIIAYEILLTDAYLSLANHLANGLVDAKYTHREWNAEKVSQTALTQNLAQAYMGKNYAQALASFNASNVRYQALKHQYAILSEQLGTSVGIALPAVTLKLGMTHSAVAILRQKLGLPADSNYFDEALKQAVIDYQSGLGLSADGVVGPGTRSMLNASHQDVLDGLMINMERQRWLPPNLGNPYILVNIPSYRVEVIKDNTSVYQSKTIVGRKDRPTPAFTDRMRHIVMSPTWTVPPTIMRQDKLPQLRSNPSALNGTYEVVTPGGRVVRPSDVNWRSVNPASYALRQKPGRHNALGRIKFLFPNRHAIYLHDTPNKGLFNRANRAYSSGCVRVQDPFDLAELLLQNTSWTPAKIKSASGKRSERWVDTPNETPIYLVYWTKWADLQGNMQFAQDIYNLDRKLLKQYQQALQ